MADTGRTGVIWVKSGSTNIAKITVNQAPGLSKYFYFDSNSATTTASTVASGATVATCAYITNYDNLTYSVSESWITAVNFNDGTLTATFTTNPDSSNRSSVITIKGNGTNVASFTVTQEAKAYFYFGSSGTETTSAGTASSADTSITITYRTNYATLTYESSESWITAVTLDNGILTATFTTNPNTNNRSSVITVKGNGSNVGTFTVTQEAKDDPAPVGTITFTYYTDEEYWDSSNPFYCSNYFVNTFGPAKIYVDGNYLRDVTIDDVVGYETWGAKYDGDWSKSDSFWQSRIWMDGNAGRNARGEEGVFTHAIGSEDIGVQLGAIVNLWGTEYKLFMCAIRYYGG